MSTTISVPVTAVWTSPEAPRDVDRPIIEPTPDPATWNRNLLPEPPSALHGRTVTQALLGEPVEVVGERDGWYEVVLPWQPSSADPRGYPGWVPAAHVAEAVGAHAPRMVVASATLHLGPLELSYGTVLPVVDRDSGRVRVGLPGGGVHTAPQALQDLPGEDTGPQVEALLASAGEFVGMRYLWGGTSGWGFDCSGFVHLAHRRFGRTVPRDAFDQLDAATPTTPEQATRGDLYFFRDGGRVTHVGFATNDRAKEPRILHAPDGDPAKWIEDGPLSAERRARLVAAGTLLPRPG